MQINVNPTFATQGVRAVDVDTQSRAGQRLEAGQALNPTGSAETQQASRLGLATDQRVQPSQDSFELGAEFLARPRPLTGGTELGRAAAAESQGASQQLEQTREATAQRVNESLGRLREQAQTSGAQFVSAQANLQPENALALLR
jgi:hypothetical protein